MARPKVKPFARPKMPEQEPPAAPADPLPDQLPSMDVWSFQAAKNSTILGYNKPAAEKPADPKHGADMICSKCGESMAGTEREQ